MPFASLIRRPALVAVAFSLVAALPAAAMPLNQPITQLPHPNLPILNKPIDQKPVLNKPIDFKPIFIPNKPPAQPVKPIPVDICVIAPSKCKNPPNNPPPNGGNGGKGPVVIIAPPPIIAPAPVLVEPQQTIIARPQYVQRPVAVQAPSAAVANVPANGPTTCLTKQYQDDGSVVFRDVCTGETAIATKEDLEAQAASRTQATSQIQDQPQPAR